MELADRVKQMAASATMAVGSKAAEMKRAGVDVVSYGQGEPDFDTPEFIKDSVKAALDKGRTKYAQPSSGLPEARGAVCEKLKRDNGLTYDPSCVLMTCGGKEAIYLTLAALINPGDEVLLPIPYWVSFIEQIRLCGGKPVLLRGDEANSFKLRPPEIVSAMTPRTRVLIFNSPSNPGGFTYARDEVIAIATALQGRDIVVISDEMYDRLTFDGTSAFSFAAAGPEWLAKTITINAASKSYAMTGWRVGWAAGPKPIIDAMGKLQTHMTSGPCTFNQLAVAEALSADQSSVEEMRAEFERRARHMHGRLQRLRDVSCVRPTGAFYCFPNVARTYGRLGVRGSADFAAKILTEAHVALVPGEAFGSDQHVRLSFACSMDEIDKGLDRLGRVLGET